MVLTGKNIKYIIILAIAGVVIYYLFFKKNASSTQKAVTGKKVGETVELPTKPAEATPPAEPVSSLEVDPAEEAKKETLETRYIGPQDCAENCGGHYDRRKVNCYKKLDYQSCLDKAKVMKQMCVSKCDQTMQSYINTEQIVNTPLQEDHYNEIFRTVLTKGYV